MVSESNHKITLKSRPDGYPKLSDFELIEEPIPQPREGEVLIKSNWLSLDPYMRGRMRDAASYAPSVQLGDVSRRRSRSDYRVTHSRLQRGRNRGGQARLAGIRGIRRT